MIGWTINMPTDWGHRVVSAASPQKLSVLNLFLQDFNNNEVAELALKKLVESKDHGLRPAQSQVLAKA